MNVGTVVNSLVITKIILVKPLEILFGNKVKRTICLSNYVEKMQSDKLFTIVRVYKHVFL